ncbi:unannotated protein [freshwater metagenome]|uniref:Unannotated protein n=1 Tax=freshwater metagenome TaxID=449393 RepID=A0A6J6IBI9_9ZZZZ
MLALWVHYPLRQKGFLAIRPWTLVPYSRNFSPTFLISGGTPGAVTHAVKTCLALILPRTQNARVGNPRIAR